MRGCASIYTKLPWHHSLGSISFHHLRVIRLHGREVKRETEVKDFGIRLNRKLLYKTHVGNPCQKAASALMTFRFIEGKKWGCIQRYHFGYRLQ